ncbi:MAG TPA: FtsL-like putative cell division protein [Williamwhitmania sp.]|nr:FtsL-like putative cell division protein [Williamwhitmania sp.]
MLGKEEQVEFEKEPEEPKKAKKKSNPLKDIMTGSMLAKEAVTGQLPYIVFLVFMALVYIGNRYRTERIVSESTKLQKEVENLRSESITTAAELMNISKQSEVARIVKQQGLGLEESVKPPQIIKKSIW